MPEIFGLKPIGYWPSCGLIILSCVLFRNWGSPEDSRRREREHKKELRRYMRGCCRKIEECRRLTGGISINSAGSGASKKLYIS